MLVLTRKVGEKLYIGSDIILEILSMDRGKIRIGIEAPKSTSILRGELAKKLNIPDDDDDEIDDDEIERIQQI